MNVIVRITTCLLLLACSNLAFADEGVDRGPVYHILPDVDMIPTTSLEYGRPRIVIKAIVPKLVSAADDLIIDDYNDVALNLIDEESEDYKEAVQSHEESQNTMASAEIKNDVIIDFDSSILNKGQTPILSLRFDIQGVISGMSQPYRKHRVLNYDLDTGDLIELSDLFEEDSDYLEVLAENARILLSKKLVSKAMIAAGTEPKIENYQIWNMTPDGLRFTFEANQVAPAIYGAQTITIPYQELDEIIEPESVLAKCLKHKRSCFGQSIITGGFIDEAKNQEQSKLSPVVASVSKKISAKEMLADK